MTILIVILVIAAVVFFGLLYSLYNTAARNSDKMKERVVPLPQKKELDPYRDEMKMLVEQMWDLPWETVQTRSKDGLTLSGRYLHVRDGAPVLIMAHGYRGSGLRDFCGGNKIARENGYNTLLIDNRAHGKSGGNTLTFGVKERYDILCWIDYVTGRFGRDTEIFLYG
ncbi:MAG: hypothetical protein HUJ73_06320, partial [Eubacterium sp.]|nr:hypothetical protein [Eubacterium sp.]